MSRSSQESDVDEQPDHKRAKISSKKYCNGCKQETDMPKHLAHCCNCDKDFGCNNCLHASGCFCYDCNRFICLNCDDGSLTVVYCDYCSETFCNECAVPGQSGGLICENCVSNSCSSCGGNGRDAMLCGGCGGHFCECSRSYECSRCYVKVYCRDCHHSFLCNACEDKKDMYVCEDCCSGHSGDDDEAVVEEDEEEDDDDDIDEDVVKGAPVA